MVRRSFFISLFVALLFATGYLYYTAKAICPIPITYHIGTIDPQFHLSADEARLAASEAESVWEDATGQNLFTYDPKGGVVVNFVYDDRQAKTTAETQFKSNLDQTQSVSDQIHTEYTNLVAKYNTLKASYETKVNDYNTKLRTYNETVSSYNQKGGAPTDVYTRLQKTKTALDAEQKDLNQQAAQLNALVKNINTIGEQGNNLISSYNKGVTEFNNTYGSQEAFDQGTYSTNHIITVYAYANHAQLIEVLAHEMGHAMGLQHVAGSSSIMYYQIGAQPNPLKPSPADLAEFAKVCGQHSTWDLIQARLRVLMHRTIG